MDERLKSLLNALPMLPERTDGGIEQIADLVLIAEKLGMKDAAAFLTEKLEFARKWYGPKPLHPEQLSGEIHLGNSDPSTVRYIGWKTKRVGEVAYDMDGEVEAGKVPVFVMAEEFAKADQITERYSVAP
jgi:hypothetical protein